MKRFTITFVVLMFLLNEQTFAQTNFYINASAAIPLDEYAHGQNQWNCALVGENGWCGGAGLGANLDLKVKFNIGVKGLGIFLSLDGIYNGLNQSMREYFDDMKYQITQEFGGNVTVDAPWYLNVCAMTGLNYVYEINPKFSVFGELGIGANFRHISHLYIDAWEYHDGNYFNVSEMISYDPKITMAFQAGTGIEISRRIVIGVSFYHLGSARVQGDDYSYVYVGDNLDDNIQYFRFKDVTPMLIMARLGIKFGR